MVTSIYNARMKISDWVDSISRIRYFNRWVIFLIDTFCSVLSSLTVFSLVGYLEHDAFSNYTLFVILFCSLACSTVSFLVFQTYKSVIRYSTFTETGRLALVAASKIILFVPLSFFLTGLPFLILFWGGICDLIFTFFILTLVRVMLILTYNVIIRSTVTDRSNGKLLLYDTDNMLYSPRHPLLDQSGTYQIEGYLLLDKNDSLRIGGYKVYSVLNQDDFNELIDRKGITAILFSDYHAVQKESERLVRYCEKKKVRMLLLPSVDEIKGGSLNVRRLPEVRIEDLLGRDEIQINMEEIAASLKDKVVLVTGAAGSIGCELCRQLCSFNPKQLVLFDCAETPMHNLRLELEEQFPNVEFYPVIGDIRMPKRVEYVFERFHPQYVFHAAAYKHVPLMEENPCEAVYTNVYGTRNVADVAVRYGAEKFIMISTDKAVNPTNVMGASKRLAEIYVQSLGIAISKGLHPGKTHFITTRFGNVLGSNGSVIPRFREQLAKGGPLTVTHPDIIRYFMTIQEACRLVLDVSYMGKGNEIFVFDMGTPVRITDLARRMIELAGFIPDKDIRIRYTGLRPGEKLYEELLASKENTYPTDNAKVFRARVREYDYQEVCRSIDVLVERSISVDKMGTVRLMKQIVPEFKSKNSEYEVLDGE